MSLSGELFGVRAEGRIVTFDVAGEPKPKGSKRAFAVKSKDGRTRVAVAEDNAPTLRDWLDHVNGVVQTLAAQDVPSFPGPVAVQLDFRMPRRTSTRKRDTWHSKRPDIDKLSRVILDACSGVLWQDDGQVCELFATKSYVIGTERPGVAVRVAEVLG